METKETTKEQAPPAVHNLKRQIGVVSATFAVISLVIGSGIFFKPQQIFEATGGAPGLGILIMVLAGLITLAGGLCVAELSSRTARTGGMAVWLEDAYGPLPSWLVGWMQSVMSFPANIAVLGIAFGIQTVDLLKLAPVWSPIIAVGIIWVLGAFNAFGAKIGGNIGVIFTIAKMIPIGVIIVLGLVRGGTAGTYSTNLTPFASDTVSPAMAIGIGLLGAMYAYEGWIHVGNISGELKDPKKDLPKAIIFGLVFTLFVYALIFVAYVLAIPAAELATSSTPAADVARILLGEKMGNVLSIGILVSLFGTINTNILVATRMPYSMAVQNKIPFVKFFGYVHPKYKTPMGAMLFLLVMTTIMTLSGSYNSLTDMSVFTLWIFYSMTFIAVIILRRKKPSEEGSFKVPLYPIIPIFAALSGLFIIVSNLINSPGNVLIGVGLTLVGLPIYFWKRKNFKSIDAIDQGSAVIEE